MSKKSIIYNGQDLFSGQATPFLAKTIEYINVGERWGQVEKWTLNGSLTGCDFEELESARTGLMSKFTNAFGQMDVAGEFDLNPVEINTIDIDSSDYIGSLPYSISFTHYPSGSFDDAGGFYGVLNPKDSFTYAEQKNQTLEMRRSISAKGIVTDFSDKDSALNNVKNFIDSRKEKIVHPILTQNRATNAQVMEYYLLSSDESYNRLTKEGTLNQTYRTDLTSADGKVINRYTYSRKEDGGQNPVLDYQGTIDAGRYGNIEDVRIKYKDFKRSLNASFIINESIKEDLKINRIEYSFSFYENAENGLPEISDNYSIDLSESEGSSLFNASIKGDLKSNYGCLEDRNDKISGYLNSIESNGFHFDIVNLLYNQFYTVDAGSAQNKPAGVSLNRTPLSQQKSVNNSDVTSSYGASFNDRYIPSVIGTCTNFNLDISLNYGVALKSIKEYYLGGKYICQDLGTISRESISVSLNKDGVIQEVGRDTLERYAKSIAKSLRGGQASLIYDEGPTYSKSETAKTEAFSISQNYNINTAKEISL